MLPAPLAAAAVWSPLQDVLLLLLAAMLLGALAERFRQSAIVGYLFAGTIVGPSMLGWVSDQQQIFLIAEVGVALLLFVIGLEFTPRRLWELGPRTLAVGVLQVVLTTAIGYAVSRGLGLPPRAAFVVGLMLTMSSTACVLRLLSERGETDGAAGRGALGVLLVQDVAVVPMMLVVTAMAGVAGEAPPSVAAIAGKALLTLALGVALIGVFYAVSNYVLPRLQSQRSMLRNRDLPILLAVVLALGSAWAAYELELSPALGAFAAGVLLAVSPYAAQIRADVRPLSTVLITLFFTAIGMFGDPLWLLDHAWLVAAIVAVLVLLKPLVIALLAILFGQPTRYAVATGLALAQVGEFSFVLATIAQSGGPASAILSDQTFRAMVSATIVSLLLTPYFVAAGPRVGAWCAKRFGSGWSGSLKPSEATGEGSEHGGVRLLIVGFGPAGQRVAEGLLDASMPLDSVPGVPIESWRPEEIMVLDMNPGNIASARGYGLRGMVGDATQPDVLEHAGVGRVRGVVIAVPDHAATRQVVYLCRDLAPEARLVVRCRYHVWRWQLIMAGAHEVIDEEDQVGHRLAAAARLTLADAVQQQEIQQRRDPPHDGLQNAD
ncbi:Inner membrane protein YbaL [Pseudobythopirellula maris]|uniref:Inner membrane protein YbaL n=1 Tax=Pseudobythopirellula maris TaxID=2527991 RepID=A0A5C5ZHF3_9BACT|nr:cation:proton antiporter [Pseudobythopirellula maris]TWT86839.1 Inner membrane protein YbaL [Pseudobythopirellula maris]